MGLLSELLAEYLFISCRVRFIFHVRLLAMSADSISYICGLASSILSVIVNTFISSLNFSLKAVRLGLCVLCIVSLVSSFLLYDPIML